MTDGTQATRVGSASSASTSNSRRTTPLHGWRGLAAFLLLGFAAASALAVPTIVSITPNKTLPVVFGTTITWTVTATGGTAPLQYKFYRYDAGVWNMVQDYSTSNTYTWTPVLANVGQHDLSVWVKSNGSVALYDAAKDTGYFNINGLATVTAFTANPAPPRAYGSAITWTATATGAAPLQYKFWRLDKGAWVMAKDYSTSNTCSWTPAATDIGLHDMVVWVKSNGSVAQQDAFREYGSFNVNGVSSISALTANRTSPSPAGTPVVWTATATGTPGPLQYQFWRLDGTTWSMVQDYSTSNVFTCFPGVADVGNHTFAVWVRNQGSIVAYETTRASATFVIGPSVPALVTGLVNAPDLPRPTGYHRPAPAAVDRRHRSPHLSLLQVQLSRGPWTMVQDYSVNNTYTWTPTAGEVGAFQFAPGSRMRARRPIRQCGHRAPRAHHDARRRTSSDSSNRRPGDRPTMRSSASERWAIRPGSSTSSRRR